MSLDNGTFPDAPSTITILANRDMMANWVGHIQSHDITSAALAGGIYLLVSLEEDGTLRIATKPGSAWDSTWSPPIQLERR
jgi:hypothetical protein